MCGPMRGRGGAAGGAARERVWGIRGPGDLEVSRELGPSWRPAAGQPPVSARAQARPRLGAGAP